MSRPSSGSSHPEGTVSITTTKSLARWIGFLIGVALAAWVVFLGRVSAHEGVQGAHVTMATKPTQLLSVEPAGRQFLAHRDLRPGPRSGAARGGLTVHNIRTGPLAVKVAARPSSRDLDALLRVEIVARGALVFRGRLDELRRWRHAFRLDAGERARLDVRAWLPPSSGEDQHGRHVAVDLHWRTREAPA